MRIGFIGLGRMGKNMVLNLIEKGHEVVANNRSPEPIKEMETKGAIGAYSIEELVQKLSGQKVVWIMVVAGKPTDEQIEKLLPYLSKGDIIIDGGNSFFKDSIRRYNMLKAKGISFLDVGTSGGMEGARHGACMMIGGDKEVFEKLEGLFRDMCVKDGYGFMGKTGAGHFVKMVHNGIEYGMMSAIGEGIQAIENNKKDFDFDMDKVIQAYSHGSIIESRLMSWLEKAWKDDNYLSSISGEVPRGETEAEMEELEKLSDMPVLREARMTRVRTREKPTLAGKTIAAMRNQFGGHAVKKADEKK